MHAAESHIIRGYCLALDRINAPLGEGGRYRQMVELPAHEVDETLLRRSGAVGGFCDGGGRVVAEVLDGVILADLASYLSFDPGWMPTLPARCGRFGVAEVLVAV